MLLSSDNAAPHADCRSYFQAERKWIFGLLDDPHHVAQQLRHARSKIRLMPAVT